MLLGCFQRPGYFSARGGEVAPKAVREPDRCRAIGGGHRRYDAIRGQAWQHRSKQVSPDLVETETAGFAVGVLSFGAERREVVIPIDDSDAVERGDAGIVGGPEQ